MITNRDIRFRCYDTVTKRFVRLVPPVEAWLDSDKRDGPEELWEATMFYPSNPIRSFDGRLAYDQFTGVKDTDGNEVWEGDIVDIGGVRHLIEWRAGGFYPVGYDDVLTPLGYAGGFKVVGNRWEQTVT